MKAALFALALAVVVVGCGPVETDESTDPAQVACEGRGGDYLCKGTRPDGSLDCACVVP